MVLYHYLLKPFAQFLSYFPHTHSKEKERVRGKERNLLVSKRWPTFLVPPYMVTLQSITYTGCTMFGSPRCSTMSQNHVSALSYVDISEKATTFSIQPSSRNQILLLSPGPWHSGTKTPPAFRWVSVYNEWFVQSVCVSEQACFFSRKGFYSSSRKKGELNKDHDKTTQNGHSNNEKTKILFEVLLYAVRGGGWAHDKSLSGTRPSVRPIPTNSKFWTTAAVYICHT